MAGQPLDYLQECINGIHHLLTQLDDPQDVQAATGALAALVKVQRDLMGRQQGNPMMQQLAQPMGQQGG